MVAKAEPVLPAAFRDRLVGNPIKQTCDCECPVVAIPSIIGTKDGLIFGYSLECLKCHEWQWLPHDWTKCPAKFAPARKEE